MHRHVRPPLIAAACLLLVAGTALAAAPTISPFGSPAPVASSHPTPAPSDGHPTIAPSGAATKTDTDGATESPDGPPSPEQAARFVARLADAGISVSVADFQVLAAKVGVGGAVRAFAFARASGKTPAQIVAMVQAGTGWGEIARQLHLSIGPGIGWIMGGGHGHGNGHANSHGNGQGNGS